LATVESNITENARARRFVFLPTFLILSALSVLWALAGPVFSSPDENAHALKAVAQVRGQVIGHELPGIQYIVVDLPDSYRYNTGILCFVRESDASASCNTELGDPAGTDWFNTWVGAYNPVYYYLVGWPSLLFDGSAGIYAMRIVSGILGAALLAWAVVAAMASTRMRWMPIGVAFAMSPMVSYLAGSVTPQGLEISASVLLWISLLRLLESFRVGAASVFPRSQLWAMVTVAGVALVTARALGPLWLVLIFGACVTIVGWQEAKALFLTRASYSWMTVIAGAGLFSVIWTLAGGSLSGQAEVSEVPLVGGSFFQGAWAIIRRTPWYIEQAAGVFGWLDTGLPSVVYPAYYIAFAIVAVLAFTATGRRGVWTLSLVVALALLVPAVVQGYSVSQTGLIWQGRYGIFLYLAIPLVGGWLLSAPGADRVAFMSVRITSIVAALLALYGSFAYLLVMRRYVVGTDDTITSMLSTPEWLPPLGWLPLILLAVLAYSGFAVWIVRLSIVAARQSDRQ